MQYYDENALLIDDRRQIAKHYMSSWFFLDLATSTPVDQIICALGFEKNIDGQIVRRFLHVCVCVCVCVHAWKRIHVVDYRSLLVLGRMRCCDA